MRSNGLSNAKLIAAMMVVCAGPVPIVRAQTYQIIDLGILGGTTSSTARAINNNGEVVGTFTTADSELRGFLWKGYVTDLGPLAGDTQAQAFDINDAGETAVMSFALGAIDTHGILWNATTPNDLGALAARGVNSLGVVVGHVGVTVPNEGVYQQAAKWDAGAAVPLGTLGGDFSYAYAVNDFGEAVGMSLLAGNQGWRAALYKGGAVVNLGTLGGGNSQAYDINNAHQVVGVSDTSTGQPHAVLFNLDAGGHVTSLQDLGTLDGKSSYANAINAGGVIVGTSGYRAFKWEADVMTDLNSLLPPNSGWVLEVAYGINNQGSIVGQGQRYGQPRAFLLAVVEICMPVDADFDGDVDLRDYGTFLNSFTGPIVP